MKAKRLTRFFHAICAIALHGASASAGEIEWRDGASLLLEGGGFPGQTSSPYVRIPDRWRDSIPVEVWRVSRTSMGLCARFATDSHTVAVRWDVDKIPAPHPQMAPGGQTGIDIYRRPRGGGWQHVRMATPDPETARGVVRVAWTPGDECLVYLPMRTRDLRSFEIGADASSASVDNCREADGDTKRNVAFALTRSSGAAIAAASGSTGCALLDAGAASTGTSDAYAFTLSKLVPNAAYTLYLYGTGDALFTVGGESKAPDGQWFRSDYEPCFARFEATADANGAISGSFAASSENGAAFGGLTIVGEFPDYHPEAFVITIR